jgi:hypothetical protein
MKKLEIDFTKIPKLLKVDVKKGETGVLIAELPSLGVSTEADDLNELFFNVNDLIYTYFDIPKKYQDKICFIPNVSAREELLKIAQHSKTSKFSEFKIKTFYTEDLCRSIISA